MSADLPATVLLYACRLQGCERARIFPIPLSSSIPSGARSPSAGTLRSSGRTFRYPANWDYQITALARMEAGIDALPATARTGILSVPLSTVELFYSNNGVPINEDVLVSLRQPVQYPGGRSRRTTCSSPPVKKRPRLDFRS